MRCRPGGLGRWSLLSVPLVPSVNLTCGRCSRACGDRATAQMALRVPRGAADVGDVGLRGLAGYGDWQSWGSVGRRATGLVARLYLAARARPWPLLPRPALGTSEGTWSRFPPHSCCPRSWSRRASGLAWEASPGCSFPVLETGWSASWVTEQVWPSEPRRLEVLQGSLQPGRGSAPRGAREGVPVAGDGQSVPPWAGDWPG